MDEQQIFAAQYDAVRDFFLQTYPREMAALAQLRRQYGPENLAFKEGKLRLLSRAIHQHPEKIRALIAMGKAQRSTQ